MATPMADMEFDSPSKEKEDKEDESLHADSNANAGQEKAEAEDAQKKLKEVVLAGDVRHDARLSVNTELKLAISMKDLTVDAQGKKYAFHEKKAREHDDCHLGGGSFGEVFKAKHTVHGVVAVKLAKPGKEDRIKMCKKEIEKHVNALTSDKVVSIKGFVECEDRGCHCDLIGIVMNFMEQGSLWDFRLKRWKDEPDLWPLTNRMVYEISLGMHFLHSNDIIHRDLKLENVLVDADRHVKIADLGLATNLQTSVGDKCCGTNSHKPPEAFRTDLPASTKVVTKKYDVYSFAMTLYELLTGIHPYSESGPLMISLLKAEAKQTPSLQPIPENATAGLIEVMEKSWRYEPCDRPYFTEITEFVGELNTKPYHESKGYYLGQPSSFKKGGETASKLTKPVLPSNTDNEAVRRGIENLNVNDQDSAQHECNRAGRSMEPKVLVNPSIEDPPGLSVGKPLKSFREHDQEPRKRQETGDKYEHVQPHLSGDNNPVRGSGDIHQESSRVVQCQPSSSERDTTIVFDFTPPSDQDFEIKLQVKLTVPIGASIASKVDQILSSLGRCKYRAYWPTNNSSLCTMFLSHKVTLQTLQLPPTVGEDQFTIFLRVSNKSALENLHSLSKTGLLQLLLVQSFVDRHLEDLCRPVQPDLKVDQWEEQFNKGMEHFQKKENADDSSQSESEHSESRSERPKTTKPKFSLTRTDCSGTTQIQTGKVNNMIFGDQTITYNHYHGTKGSREGGAGGAGGGGGAVGGGGGAVRGRDISHQQHKQKKQEKTKLCESTEKVNQNTLLDVVELISGNAVESLGRHLGLKDVKVENIVYDNRNERSSEIAYKVLREWKQFKGHQATKVVLANALWKANCYDAARNVR